jgi:molybdate transport system substrate-binding protein
MGPRPPRTPRPPRVLAVVAVALATAVAACSGSTAPSAAPGSEPVELVVFGAASLKGPLTDAAAAYEAANPTVQVTVSTDSSAALATQIQEGAPADVFLSADTTNAQALVDKGLAEGAPVAFAGNELTVIVPADNPAGLTSPMDLATPGVKVIAAGAEVPITRYAMQLVANLARQPGYPPDFGAAYAANIASREDNVKAVVAKIELGEGDAGIVYRTDAAASGKVATLDVPADANVPATYAGVVVGTSRHRDAAAAFLDWLAGAGGQAILARYGFLPAP